MMMMILLLDYYHTLHTLHYITLFAYASSSLAIYDRYYYIIMITILRVKRYYYILHITPLRHMPLHYG